MFVKVMQRSTVITTLLFFGCILFGWLLLTWPAAASSGISRGLAICSSIIIPSLFPFLVLADFLVRSGLSGKIGRSLEKPVRFVFNLPGCCAPAIIMGLIGGYPAGGIAVGELVKEGQITREQGRRMLGFCVNGGPAFIISAIGAGMMGNVKYGIMLYTAHIAASVLLGVFLRFGSPKIAENTTQMYIRPTNLSPAAAFVESVGAACHSLLLMCGFIVLFAAVLSLADASGLSIWFQSRAAALLRTIWPSDSLEDILGCIFPCLLEVSCGSVQAARTGAAAPLILGAALGFGGISVHCQIASVLRGLRLLNRGFFVLRIMHAITGGLFSLLLFRVVPVAAPAFRPFSDALVLPFSANAAASAALLCLCALFLLTIDRRTKEVYIKRSGKEKENMLL